MCKLSSVISEINKLWAYVLSNRFVKGGYLVKDFKYKIRKYIKK